MAAEISTGHYFTAQQEKGNLFTGPRNRWKMKLSWQAFSEMENRLWAVKGVIRKELLGTQEVELIWTFLFFKGLLSMVTKEVKYLSPHWNNTRKGICNVYNLYSSVEMQGMEECGLSGSNWYKEFSAVPQTSHKMLEMTSGNLVRTTALSEYTSKGETNLRLKTNYSNSPITDTCGEHSTSKNTKSLLKVEFSPVFTTSAHSFGWSFTLKRLLPVGCAHPQAQTGAISTLIHKVYSKCNH